MMQSITKSRCTDFLQQIMLLLGYFQVSEEEESYFRPKPEGLKYRLGDGAFQLLMLLLA
jgi:hypothetical protein